MPYRESQLASARSAPEPLVALVPNAERFAPEANRKLREVAHSPPQQLAGAELASAIDANPSAWRTVVHNSISELEASGWDAVAGRQAVIRSHAYLRAIESAGVSGCRYYYPVIYDGHGAIVAHACVYRVSTDFAQLLPRMAERAVTGLRRWWPSLLKSNIIECASPLSAGSSISIVHGAPRAQVIAAIETAMSAIAEQESSALLVIRDFLGHERSGLEFLHTLGYKCVSNLPLARIRVRWDSYDDYLGSMRARYRKDIRRRLRRSTNSGRQVEVLSHFGQDAALWSQQAAAIYAQTKGFKRESVNAEYYAQMDSCLKRDSQLLVVNRNGQRIAHGMVLFDQENTVATFFGRNNGPAGGEWFQLMNEVIRLGIERGSRFICLGLGSYDAKTIVGADVEPLYVYTRCTNKWLNRVIKMIPDLMKQQPPPERRLFRADEVLDE